MRHRTNKGDCGPDRGETRSRPLQKETAGRTGLFGTDGLLSNPLARRVTPQSLKVPRHFGEPGPGELARTPRGTVSPLARRGNAPNFIMQPFLHRGE